MVTITYRHDGTRRRVRRLDSEVLNSETYLDNEEFNFQKHKKDALTLEDIHLEINQVNSSRTINPKDIIQYLQKRRSVLTDFMNRLPTKVAEEGVRNLIYNLSPINERETESYIWMSCDIGGKNYSWAPVCLRLPCEVKTAIEDLE